MAPALYRKFDSISVLNAYLLKTGLLADCEFHVGTSKTIVLAHRLILSPASPIFRIMFRENSSKSVGQIFVVADIEKEEFLTFLNFLYTNDVRFKSVEQASKLYHAAHKYKIDSLSKLCVDYIKRNINIKNICCVLNLMLDYDIDAFRKSTSKVIINQTRRVLSSPEFTNLHIASLNFILERKKLSICNELELFEALERYAENRIFSKVHQEDIDGVLKESLLLNKEQYEFALSFMEVVKKEYTTHIHMHRSEKIHSNSLPGRIHQVDESPYIPFQL